MSRAGIETLRQVAAWADWQLEDHWLPEVASKTPTVAQIVQLWTLCQAWGVDTPEDLAEVAPNTWQIWYARRG